jgi:hypothetical protein
VSTAADDIAIDRRVGDQGPELYDELADLHEATKVGKPQAQEPFSSRQQFLDRLAGYARSRGFVVVTARAGSELVGFVFGYPLPATARWWNGLLDPTPDGFTVETGSRTFALCELQVADSHRGRRLATRIHQPSRGDLPPLGIYPDRPTQAIRRFTDLPGDGPAAANPEPDPQPRRSMTNTPTFPRWLRSSSEWSASPRPWRPEATGPGAGISPTLIRNRAGARSYELGNRAPPRATGRRVVPTLEECSAS